MPSKYHIPDIYLVSHKLWRKYELLVAQNTNTHRPANKYSDI